MLRDYSFVKQSNPWLTSSNAAGLTTYKSTNIAEAELGLAYESGGLIDYWQAPKVFQVNASAEAIQRLSSRTVVFGRVSYENFSGRDMAGSAFINPTRKGAQAEDNGSARRERRSGVRAEEWQAARNGQMDSYNPYTGTMPVAAGAYGSFGGYGY